MAKQYPRVLIVSAEKAHLSDEENEARTKRLRSCLVGLNIGDVVGAYKGDLESAFIVLPRNEQEVNEVAAMAWHFQQVCYLDIDERRIAVSVNVETRERTTLGKLVGSPVMPDTDSWTYAPAIDTYFYVRGTLRSSAITTTEINSDKEAA